MNASEIISGIRVGLVTNIDQRKVDAVKQLDDYKSFMVWKIQTLKDNLLVIEDALKSYGFEITKIVSIRKTGVTGDWTDLSDKDQLNVTLQLKMISKRKPLNTDFKDYDKNGASKSAKKARETVSNIAKDFSLKLPGFWFTINYYSLNRAENINANIWVK